jgi:hypothetical protein
VTRARILRVFWLGAAALLVAAALIAIVALLRGELTETDGEILLTLGALFVAGAVGLAGLGLAESGRYALLGWTAAALAPVEFGIFTYWIWSDLSGDTLGKVGLTTILLVLGQLALVTHLLLLTGRTLLPLVGLTSLLLALAGGGTITAIWTEPDDTSWAKALAVLWILAGLCWFLLPVLQRYTAAGTPAGDRVLDVLDGVELVASRAREGLDVRLARGERLVLRRRT